ncbi:MAG: hypothetical protein GY799_23720, partial [Desulfobulbaceae bacterium]|nr:hypothetical protein [Desulfobulbaceae bacterium]
MSSNLKTGEGFPLLHKPLVEKHSIQTCNLDNDLSNKLRDETDPELDNLTRKFPKLFSEGVGIFNGEKHRIHVKPEAIPCHSRMREAPQAYAQLAKEEIESMLQNGLCERIRTSNWVSPVHYVKKDGKCIRVMVD